MEQFTCGERSAAHQDYQQYDRIWQRVSPELDPYPEVRSAMASAGVSGSATAGTPAVPATPATPVTPSAPAVPVTPATPPAPVTRPLPGDIQNPCCMGTEAQVSLGVLQGFLDEECRQRLLYLGYARRMGDRSGILRQLADHALEHIRRLAAACYLITGQCCRPMSQSPVLSQLTWCQLLRLCYHQSACNRFNYLRAADEATDQCLTELFQDLGAESGEDAEAVFRELSRLMCRQR